MKQRPNVQPTKLGQRHVTVPTTNIFVMAGWLGVQRRFFDLEWSIHDTCHTIFHILHCLSHLRNGGR